MRNDEFCTNNTNADPDEAPPELKSSLMEHAADEPEVKPRFLIKFPYPDYKMMVLGRPRLGIYAVETEYEYGADFFTTSMLWTVIAAALVFLMHLGFATLESGLCQQKNVVNVLFKNVFIISIGIVRYAVIGFNTHYPLGELVMAG